MLISWLYIIPHTFCYPYFHSDLFSHRSAYLQCTVIGPSCPNCSLVLWTWPMKSMNPSPVFGTPCSGQSVNWNWRMVLDCPSWREWRITGLLGCWFLSHISTQQLDTSQSEGTQQGASVHMLVVWPRAMRLSYKLIHNLATIYSRQKALKSKASRWIWERNIRRQQQIAHTPQQCPQVPYWVTFIWNKHK